MRDQNRLLGSQSPARDGSETDDGENNKGIIGY